MNFKKALFFILLTALTACGKTKESMLNDRVESFNESLRWASVKAASAFMDEHNKRTLIEQYAKEFQKTSIVEYSILDIGLSPSKDTGTVLVEFSFYDNSTQDLSYRQEIQTWSYDSLMKNWVMKEARAVAKNNTK